MQLRNHVNWHLYRASFRPEGCICLIEKLLLIFSLVYEKLSNVSRRIRKAYSYVKGREAVLL